jgi:hypothetical protein
MIVKYHGTTDVNFLHANFSFLKLDEYLQRLATDAYEKVSVHDSQSRERVKYCHESRGTRIQEWLCWLGPAAICPTDPSS